MIKILPFFSATGFRSLSLATLLAMWFPAAPELVAEDLTVTVRENANGSTTFRLSGSSTWYETGFPMTSGVTNFSYAGGVPPLSPLVTVPFTIPMPTGLFLTLDDPAPGGAETVPVDRVFAYNPVSFSGKLSWFLISFGVKDTAPIFGSISGSGSVTIADFPFFLLEPGRFVVEPGDAYLDSPEEAAPTEIADPKLGYFGFRTIYEVIPADKKPAIDGTSGVLIAPQGGRASGEIRITNSGNVPLEGIAVSGASPDFRIGRPVRTSLDPGQSTTCPVVFEARRGRSASVMVSLSAKTPDRSYTPEMADGSEAEQSAAVEDAEGPGPITEPGVTVRSRVKVRGEIAAPRPKSPRFPFGFLGPR